MSPPQRWSRETRLAELEPDRKCSSVAGERDEHNVRAFRHHTHVLGALIAGGHEDTDLLAGRRLMRRKLVPHPRAVLPVPGQPRGADRPVCAPGSSRTRCRRR